MKYLVINNNKGYYIKRGKKQEIDHISKEDIYELISILINIDENEDFEMDEFSEEKLQHGVHSIIYRNLYNKFLDLKKERESIHDLVNQQFMTAFQKYNK